MGLGRLWVCVCHTGHISIGGQEREKEGKIGGISCQNRGQIGGKTGEFPNKIEGKINQNKGTHFFQPARCVVALMVGYAT